VPTRRSGEHASHPLEARRSWPKIHTVIGIVLLMAGIAAIANGGIEAAMGPRLENMFGSRSGETWPWIVASLVIGVVALATGIGFLVVAGRKHTTE
jgi:hypothetical protein